MYSVCVLWLWSNYGVWPAADKKCYLQLTVEKMHVFAVFTDKYLRPYGCNDSNFTAAVNCVNSKTVI